MWLIKLQLLRISICIRSKTYRSRREFLTNDAPVDWAFAEALAFGTLLLEGIPVRLSGQDSARGTFSQRHIVLTDMETEEELIPHNNIAPELAKIEPLDSLLSEAAVLGFELVTVLLTR
jgi:2-oxoglutarate dehydrogenase E1 component